MFWRRKSKPIKTRIKIESLHFDKDYSGFDYKYTFHPVPRNLKYVAKCIDAVNSTLNNPVATRFISCNEEKAVIEFTGLKDNITKIINSIMLTDTTFLDMYSIKEA
ncbi:MAG: hypothetical protein J6R47_04285 [Acholeplasmatales bacterium]|nr:hypothetical protein [Acholeplasmatales bacterium]